MTEFDLVRKERARRSLKEFVRQAWPILEPDTPYKENWHIDAICEHLEAVSWGEIKNLIINVPPGCMKSLTTCVFWPCWEWATNPWLRYIFGSYAATFSKRDSVKCRSLINSQWYQRNYVVSLDKWTEEKLTNTRGGLRLATSVEGVGTGERVHRVIHDDLLKAQDAFSKAERNRALEHMKAMATRGADPAAFSQVLIMQRLHEEDPTAWALANGGWEHLLLPMEYEPQRHCTTSIGFSDPRGTEGELLWPEHFTRKSVDELKIPLGTYGTASQLQQRPAALGGDIIKGEWFGRYEALPTMEYRMIFGDTAQKTKEAHDYSVFECWGRGVDGQIYIIDMIRGKWTAPELRRQAIAFWKKHNAENDFRGFLRQLGIEDKSSGTGLIQDIQESESIPIKAIQRSTDKLTRVMDVVSYIERGYVNIPLSASWVQDFIAECEAFTADNSHAHDDQIDPMCDAIKEMLANQSTFEAVAVGQLESSKYDADF